jgi:hypothetical protein
MAERREKMGILDEPKWPPDDRFVSMIDAFSEVIENAIMSDFSEKQIQRAFYTALHNEVNKQ